MIISSEIENVEKSGKFGKSVGKVNLIKFDPF